MMSTDQYNSSIMSRKVKSVKYTHFSALPLKKLISSPQIPQQQQTNQDKVIQSVLQDILKLTHQNILCKEQILLESYNISLLLDQHTQQYFYFQNYSFPVQSSTCEDQPTPSIAPEAKLCRKQNNLQSKVFLTRRSSKQKLHHSQLQDYRKTIEKCKKERDLKRHCSNGSFLPLNQSLYRASQDNTEQIQQLMRRKKELFLEVNKDSRTKAKSKVISTQRKEKKLYFHNDLGQALQMSFSDQLGKANRLIPVNVKVQQGQAIAINLKKKAIVQYASTNKKSRRRIDRNLGDTCVLIQQIKENDLSVWSAVKRAHNDYKNLRMEEEQIVASALKLPTVR